MKQTAVEWLEKEIEKFHNWKRNPVFDENCFDEIELDKSINQAKEIEKQQIIDAHINGQSEYDKGAYRKEVEENSEYYYNETFKKK